MRGADEAGGVFVTTVYTVMDDSYAEPATLYICSTREHAERCLEEMVRRLVESYSGMEPDVCRKHFYIEEVEMDSYLLEQRREYWSATSDIGTGKTNIGHGGFDYTDSSECGHATAHEWWCKGKSYVSQEHATELAVECRRAELAKRGAG